MKENRNDLISVVVPIYNVEKYLEECVQSIINQSYNNIEILLIDDGSTDGSGMVCDKLAERDNRIKVFHKINGGLSDARNYGIEYAIGKYVMFVDSDDVVDEDMVKLLYGIITSVKNIKLAVCCLSHFVDGENPIFCKNGGSVILSKEEAVIDFLYQKGISTSACGKLYAMELLENIRFIKGQRFEDNEFMFNVISSCEIIGYNSSKLYAYRHRLNSITTTNFGEKDFDIIEIGKRILEKSNVLSPAVRNAAIVYQCTNCLRVFLTASGEYMKDRRYEYCKKYLKINAKPVIKNKDARKKLKIGLFLFYIGVPHNVLKIMRNEKKRWS